MIDKSGWIIRINQYVDKKTFAKSLADHYWTHSEDFPEKLTRKRAKEILVDRLCRQGREGIEKHAWEGASQEFVQPWEDAYESAVEWLDKNYPFLK